MASSLLSSLSLHTVTLSRRLEALTEAYKQTLQRIHRIPRTPDPDDLERLTSSIRDSLNEVSEELDVATLLIEDLGGVRADTEENKQKLQLSVQAQRLGEDVRNAKQALRRTQINMKVAEDTARRKARYDRLRRLREPALPAEIAAHSEQQTAIPLVTTISPPPVLSAKRRKQEDSSLEHDTLVNASSDVLAALRQTHALLTTELSRSQFAHEILTSSTRELEQLNESYTDLDAILKTSKGLVTQLMKSNKSDTWYLLTARTVLLAVLAWLVWRRLLWGPTWWLVWLPLKIMYMTLVMVMTPFGLGRHELRSGDATAPSMTSLSFMPSMSQDPLNIPLEQGKPHIMPGQGDGSPRNGRIVDHGLSEKIGKMVESATKVIRGDGVELGDSEEPRNPKKRYMDTSGQDPSIESIIEDIEGHEQLVVEQGVDAEQIRNEL